MRAAVYKGPGKVEVDINYPEPKVGPEDVLVRVSHCGICGSDLGNYAGEQLYSVPMVIGHEFSGWVAKVGEKAGTLAQGMSVTGITTRTGFGVMTDGAFADYVVIPSKYVLPLPPGLAMQDAALFEPIANMAHIHAYIKRLTDVDDVANTKILIVGGGALGQLLLQVLSAHGVNNVGVVDTREHALRLAQELGAIVAVPPAKKFAIKKAFGGNLPDVIVDCAGKPESYDFALKNVKPQGLVIFEGIHKDPIPVSILELIYKEIRIQGSFGLLRADALDALQILAAGKIATSKMITRIISLEKIVPEGLEVLRNPANSEIKIMVKITDSW